MKAMLNYGASAQLLLNYKTDALANSILSDADKVLPDVDVSEYKHTVSGSEEGIEISGASLLLDYETTLRVYYKLTGDKTIDEYTFTINGEEVTPAEKNGEYYIELKNIAAHKLNTFHQFTVGGLTLDYSALSYVNTVLTKSTDEVTINMVKALYAYNVAAQNYIK